jgi:hypothetical protein
MRQAAEILMRTGNVEIRAMLDEALKDVNSHFDETYRDEDRKPVAKCISQVDARLQ